MIFNFNQSMFKLFSIQEVKGSKLLREQHVSMKSSFLIPFILTSTCKMKHKSINLMIVGYNGTSYNNLINFFGQTTVLPTTS